MRKINTIFHITPENLKELKKSCSLKKKEFKQYTQSKAEVVIVKVIFLLKHKTREC